jgi:hypothetical protein
MRSGERGCRQGHASRAAKMGLLPSIFKIAMKRLGSVGCHAKPVRAGNAIPPDECAPSRARRRWCAPPAHPCAPGVSHCRNGAHYQRQDWHPGTIMAGSASLVRTLPARLGHGAYPLRTSPCMPAYHWRLGGENRRDRRQLSGRQGAPGPPSPLRVRLMPVLAEACSSRG